MPAAVDDEDHDVSHQEWLTRERSLAIVLLVATAIALSLCYVVISPFLPALAWGLALAIIAHPLEKRLRHVVNNRNVTAAMTVAGVAFSIVGPVLFVTHSLVGEAGRALQTAQHGIESGEWQERLKAVPVMKSVLPWMEAQLKFAGTGTTPDESGGDEAKTDDSATSDTKPEKEPDGGQSSANQQGAAVAKAAAAVGPRLGTIVSSAVWMGMQLFITLMSLFFFLRDRHAALSHLRRLLPLADQEADEVFGRIDDTIHATIFGSVVVAIVQGCMGGLIFWWLGLPSPLLWGAVMGLLAVVPVLGTFVIWAPTAVGLACHGDWSHALILAAWGGLAIGLVDNLLYPYLVGQRLRFHTLLVFFSIVGGLAAFGASGVILGPVLLAVTDALLDVWRRRTAAGGTVEGGV